MKKHYLIFGLIVAICSFISHYYGVHRGADAATKLLTFNLSNQMIEEMDMHAALLLSIKQSSPQMTLQIAQSLVKHDEEHLNSIEALLADTAANEAAKLQVKQNIAQVKATHEMLNNL